ncbi:hypothetical protein [Microbacterium sp. VKM Ac-2923]|uniref:hypothetical protein n=1 Tax=Microbacterium sp. VKM Ac-2923 TaxID=2929476 RepID=UPI001FB39820|nr:hypothetical protein [Microbacterium sp. VKM Ac-2923]MCJ1706903.1 hypothetical protein [Microbacterium sp. VKM Ac-2923]
MTSAEIRGETAGDQEIAYMRTHPDEEEIRSVEAEISEHPGHRLHFRLRDLRRILEAWAGFSQALSALLWALETKEEMHKELIANVGPGSGRDQIIRALDQATIAYVAGLGAVIDHGRNISKGQSATLRHEYDERSRKLLDTVAGAAFLGKLRNYVLHSIAAPWVFNGQFTTDPPISSAVVALEVEALLENKTAWTADAKTFILASGDRVPLSPILGPYLSAMWEHIGWLIERVADENEDLFREADELIKRRNLLLTGGVSDGRDWEARIAHVQENINRVDRGEPQINFETGGPFSDEDQASTGS